jgi:hypothetical protein
MFWNFSVHEKRTPCSTRGRCHLNHGCEVQYMDPKPILTLKFKLKLEAITVESNGCRIFFESSILSREMSDIVYFISF